MLCIHSLSHGSGADAMTPELITLYVLRRSALVLHEHKGWEGGRWVVHPQGEPISINIENFNLSHWKAKKGPPEKNIHQTVG